MMIRPSSEILMSKTTEAKSTPQEEALGASVQVLPLPAGLYLFSVTAGNAVPSKAAGQLSLPAVYVGAGPGVPSDVVEFVAGPNVHGHWLFASGDMLITKVNAPGATLVMTSVRAPGGDVLSIKVERLDARTHGLAATRQAVGASGPAHVAAVPVLAPKEVAKAAPRSETDGLSLKTSTHIRARGDLAFTDAEWAGRAAPGLWIESFSLLPLEVLSAQDVEYKGLTGSGFETPWISDDKLCGTRGMGVPLVGFAIRLKSTVTATGYDCEYSGYFASGAIIGPLRNGAPCRSSVANDPLEGVQIRIRKRSAAKADPALERAAARTSKVPRRP
jgi:hypothetical protein